MVARPIDKGDPDQCVRQLHFHPLASRSRWAMPIFQTAEKIKRGRELDQIQSASGVRTV